MMDDGEFNPTVFLFRPSPISQAYGQSVLGFEGGPGLKEIIERRERGNQISASGNGFSNDFRILRGEEAGDPIACPSPINCSGFT